MFDMVTNLISERKIPTLDELQMEALLHHLFTATPRDMRIQVAEVAFRYDHDHPRAMDVFLASALPLAERAARKRAAKIFVHPSDLQIELMYGGAVEAVIAVFSIEVRVEAGGRCFSALSATGYGAGSRARLLPARGERRHPRGSRSRGFRGPEKSLLGLKLRTRSSLGNCWTR